MRLRGGSARSGGRKKAAGPPRCAHPVPSGRRGGAGPSAVTFHMLRAREVIGTNAA